MLGIDRSKVRVRQTETGGGFGGKEDYPSILGAHAALLASKARRPVVMIYDRMEDLHVSPKRHPSIVRHRTGVSKEGKLTAVEIDLLMDAGAYTTLTMVVLQGIRKCTPKITIIGIVNLDKCLTKSLKFSSTVADRKSVV